MTIEKQELNINNLYQVNQQLSLSKDLVEMLKENQRRVEEDNKYLKDQLDSQNRLFAEKEVIWSRELKNFKKIFKAKIGYSSNFSQSSDQNFEENSKTMHRSSPLLHTPEKNEKENNVNHTITINKSDFVTLHHPESASSRYSPSVSALAIRLHNYPL